MKDTINNLKKSDSWKIQLTITNNFIPSIDTVEEHATHSKCNKIEIIINDEANEVIKELVDPLTYRYQINLESTLMFSYCIMNVIKLIRIVATIRIY